RAATERGIEHHLRNGTLHRRAARLWPADLDRDVPQALNIPLLRVDRPGPAGIFIERYVGLRCQRYGAGHDLREFGLPKLGGRVLQFPVRRRVAGQRNQPANTSECQEKDCECEQNLQKRESAPPFSRELLRARRPPPFSRELLRARCPTRSQKLAAKRPM